MGSPLILSLGDVLDLLSESSAFRSCGTVDMQTHLNMCSELHDQRQEAIARTTCHGTSDATLVHPAKRVLDEDVQFISSNPVKRSCLSDHSRAAQAIKTALQPVAPANTNRPTTCPPSYSYSGCLPVRALAPIPNPIPMSHTSLCPPSMDNFTFYKHPQVPSSSLRCTSEAISPRQQQLNLGSTPQLAQTSQVSPASTLQTVRLDEISCLDVRWPMNYATSPTISVAPILSTSALPASPVVSRPCLESSGHPPTRPSAVSSRGNPEALNQVEPCLDLRHANASTTVPDDPRNFTSTSDNSNHTHASKPPVASTSKTSTVGPANSSHDLGHQQRAVQQSPCAACTSGRPGAYPIQIFAKPTLGPTQPSSFRTPAQRSTFNSCHHRPMQPFPPTPREHVSTGAATTRYIDARSHDTNFFSTPISAVPSKVNSLPPQFSPSIAREVSDRNEIALHPTKSNVCPPTAASNPPTPKLASQCRTTPVLSHSPLVAGPELGSVPPRSGILSPVLADLPTNQPRRPTPQQSPPPCRDTIAKRRKHAQNILVDVAETIEEIFPFDIVARRHGVQPHKVFEALAAIVQVPLLRCATDKRRAGKLASDRMRQYREARKAWIAREAEAEKRQEKELRGEVQGVVEPLAAAAVPAAWQVADMLPPADLPLPVENAVLAGLW